MTQPSSELALNVRRAPSSASTAGERSGPGSASGSGSPANRASASRAGGLGHAERGERAVAVAGGLAASARASVAGVVASSAAITARSGPRTRSIRSGGSPSGSTRSRTSSTNGERAQGGAVLVAALPAQVEALGRPRDAGVEEISLLVGLVGAAQVGVADLRSALLGEQRVGRRGARELALLQPGAEQRARARAARAR